MINTVTNEVPNFLDDKPTDIDKISWKQAYATYLNMHNKTPEECESKPVNLIELLPVIQKLDTKWANVEPEMMKTTHKMVHRLNMFLVRFKTEIQKVYDVMYDIRENQDCSAEVDKTNNPDRTASEKSDSEQE